MLSILEVEAHILLCHFNSGINNVNDQWFAIEEIVRNVGLNLVENKTWHWIRRKGGQEFFSIIIISMENMKMQMEIINSQFVSHITKKNIFL